jgi:transposase InsO family protein
MRFAFIAAEKTTHAVSIFRCLRVTRRGFYAWARRGRSARAQRDLVLRTKLRAFHAASGDRYGRPRLWKDLQEDGEAVSEKRVRRLMREEGLEGHVPKRFKQTTNSHHDFDYIEEFYDRRRHHSTLGQISPGGVRAPRGGIEHGRCHPCGRQERAPRDLENRTERGFPQRGGTGWPPP